MWVTSPLHAFPSSLVSLISLCGMIYFIMYDFDHQMSELGNCLL